MKLIATTTLGSPATSITFSSIPQTFTDLLLVASVRWTGAALDVDMPIYLNGSAAGSTRLLYGNGSSVVSATTAYTRVYAGAAGTSATANTFSSVSVYIPNYTSGSKKSMSGEGVVENNATTGVLSIDAILSDVTAAVTSVGIASGTNYAANTVLSLYGITKGSDGITTAS
jgi:hypothetical protein